MQNAVARPVVLKVGQGDAIRFPLDLSPQPRRLGAALLAPSAMLFGAVGLALVWASVPRASLAVGASPQPAEAAATPRQITAVEQAGVRESGQLGRLLADLGAPLELVRPQPVQITSTAAETVAELRTAENAMVTLAEQDAERRLTRLRSTFRATGLDARPYMSAQSDKHDLSPLELRDARVLAARLDIEPALARRLQRTARDLLAAQALDRVEEAMPLATPVDNPVRSSPFGSRTDPFTHQAAFHPGQDFSGRYGEDIHVTAPGVVSFVGQRSGYGNCVEVDHGYGFKTRYGHLSSFVVGVGTPVKTGDVIARMGSTGRSTGVHLHYEVWANGRLLNPEPFLKAGSPALRGL